MKKIFLFVALLSVAACTNTVKPEDGADMLIQLNSVPESNCVFVYKLDAEASLYSHDDAIRYLKNQIVAQNKPGNVFFLERDETVQNSWVMFGPEYKYLMTARVYDCGNKK